MGCPQEAQGGKTDTASVDDDIAILPAHCKEDAKRMCGNLGLLLLRTPLT
jgi:hypothetical protein